jgi:uncharacterized protein (TIGR02246 family)
MKKLFMIITAMVLPTLISSNTVFAGDEAEAFNTAVQNIFDTYSAANIAGDTESYMALCDENIIKMGPNRPASYGKPALEKGKRQGHKKWKYESQDIKIEETQVFGDWGFARGTFTSTLTAKSGGKTEKVDGKYLTIFKKQADGSWKIARDCYNSNVPPK